MWKSELYKNQEFIIPKLKCPFKSQLNPYYDKIIEKHREWIENIDFFQSKEISKYYNKSNASLLSGYAYGLCNEQIFTLLIKLTDWFIIVDDLLLEDQKVDIEYLNSLFDKESKKHDKFGIVLWEILNSLYNLCDKESIDNILHSLIEWSYVALNSQNLYSKSLDDLTIEDYCVSRRIDVGCIFVFYCSMAPFEPISKEIKESVEFQNVLNWFVTLNILINDIISLKKELNSPILGNYIKIKTLQSNSLQDSINYTHKYLESNYQNLTEHFDLLKIKFTNNLVIPVIIKSMKVITSGNIQACIQMKQTMEFNNLPKISCPFNSKLNLSFANIINKHNIWIIESNLFDSKEKSLEYIQSNTSVLCGYVFGNCSESEFKLYLKLMDWAIIIDDTLLEDKKVSKEYISSLIDPLSTRHDQFGKILWEILNEIYLISPKESFENLIKSLSEWLYNTLNLKSSSIFTIQEYLAIRKIDIATELILMCSMTTYKSLPMEIVKSKEYIETLDTFNYLYVLINDTYSYKKEIKSKSCFNYIIVNSFENNISIAESMNKTADEINENFNKLNQSLSILICKFSKQEPILITKLVENIKIIISGALTAKHNQWILNSNLLNSDEKSKKFILTNSSLLGSYLFGNVNNVQDFKRSLKIIDWGIILDDFLLENKIIDIEYLNNLFNPNFENHDRIGKCLWEILKQFYSNNPKESVDIMVNSLYQFSKVSLEFQFNEKPLSTITINDYFQSRLIDSGYQCVLDGSMTPYKPLSLEIKQSLEYQEIINEYLGVNSLINDIVSFRSEMKSNRLGNYIKIKAIQCGSIQEALNFTADYIHNQFPKLEFQFEKLLNKFPNEPLVPIIIDNIKTITSGNLCSSLQMARYQQY
ncbi:hypothetical protein DLAC_05826 [Tieghemostelium lacteum]|uniref:Terpene synthase n=1 Tax=Tieghemostelium lacteum TaxID=361077 RepID=A0A151ZH06_TIELA|nr:hypothetical protein DLAC_05826 [Tieghemostelium lacteum]|eukprot:KYQ93189.1 hypothetical protein DLAC_05826 [Tieghemostelium lacteum]